MSVVQTAVGDETALPQSQECLNTSARTRVEEPLSRWPTGMRSIIPSRCEAAIEIEWLCPSEIPQNCPTQLYQKGVHHFGRALPSYMYVMGFGPGM